MSVPGDRDKPFGPWNPGLQSQVPGELRALATIHRPQNVFTSIAAAEELRGLTGIPASELVQFRPQRLALHELLVRVTADFAVPDGSRIEDLGINFRAMTARLLSLYLDPEREAIARSYEQACREVSEAIETALSEALPARPIQESPARSVGRGPMRSSMRGLLGRSHSKPAAPAPVRAEHEWGPAEIEACTSRARAAGDSLEGLVFRTLARVLSALFLTHGKPWGTRELIVSLSRHIACAEYASEAVGRTIEPLLRAGAAREGYRLLPVQERPVVINTKGASASGKSTLRPLQKALVGDIGLDWADFALISPDIWRKQLLDYSSLGEHYKYAGAFTGDELAIIDRKLDRYMARKHGRGGLSHLLIDRFRFESVAPDSDEAGSNFLTRFGHTAYLYFVITPPEQLVERAWKRGLHVGRYKAVDDTLAHAIEAYTGIPNVFFTWVHRADKRIRFEFLDNSVALGERPRTVAFGDNHTINVLDVGRLLDIERYGRVSIDARSPEMLYRNREVLAGEFNTGFLRRCVAGFRRIQFVDQASGQIYLRIEAGAPVFVDRALLAAAILNSDTLAGVRAVSPAALRDADTGASAGAGADSGGAQFLIRAGSAEALCLEDPAARAGLIPTLGIWADQPRKSQ